MSELFTQLGINWKLLAAQAANFGLLLIILKLTVYGPLLKLLKERREKIAGGIRDAELAGEKLKAADAITAEKIAEGEKKALLILSATEKRSKELETELMAAAKQKEAETLARAGEEARVLIAAEKRKFHEEAARLLRHAIEKTTRAAPDTIDEKLIQEAALEMARNN